MTIGLIDVDGHNWPNLALMKLSAWHKSRGDSVEGWWAVGRYDRVYMSRVFDDTYSADLPEPLNAGEIIKGGTGYGLDNTLPPEAEHICPDYSLYPTLTKETAYGFLTRGCPRGCPFCIVGAKEGRRSRKVADLAEWWTEQRTVKLLDPNLLACPDHLELLGQLAESGALVDFTQGLDARLLTEDNIRALNGIRIQEIHFAWDRVEERETVLAGLELYKRLGRKNRHGMWGTVYILTNYDTTLSEDLDRVYRLIGMGYDPYVMVYNKPAAPEEIRRLQRWVNSIRIRKAEPDFEKYMTGRTRE